MVRTASISLIIRSYDCARFPCTYCFLSTKTALHLKRRIFKRFFGAVARRHIKHISSASATKSFSAVKDRLNSANAEAEAAVKKKQKKFF